MANLASTGVVVNERWTQGGTNGRKHTCKRVTITLSSMGTVTNNIPASAFYLKSIVQCTPLVKSDNTVIIVATPSAGGSVLLLKAAGTNAPADYSGDYNCVITGPAL